MADEIGELDLTAQASAAQTATNYITAISNDGIWVTPDDAKPSSGVATSTTTGWHISDSIELFKQGASYMKMWVDNNIFAKLRIGKEDSGHLLLKDNGIDLYGSSTSRVASLGSGSMIIGDPAYNSGFIATKHTMRLTGISSRNDDYFHVGVRTSVRDGNPEIFVKKFVVNSNETISNIELGNFYNFVSTTGMSISHIIVLNADGSIRDTNYSFAEVGNAVGPAMNATGEQISSSVYSCSYDITPSVIGPAIILVYYSINGFAPYCRIGDENGSNVLIEPAGLTIYGADNESATEILSHRIRIGKNNSAHLIAQPTGINLINNIQEDVASFSSTVRLGKSNSSHIILSKNGLDIFDNTDSKLALEPSSNIAYEIDEILWSWGSVDASNSSVVIPPIEPKIWDDHWISAGTVGDSPDAKLLYKIGNNYYEVSDTSPSSPSSSEVYFSTFNVEPLYEPSCYPESTYIEADILDEYVLTGKYGYEFDLYVQNIAVDDIVLATMKRDINSTMQVRVGSKTSGHTIVNDSGMEIFNGNISLAKFGTNVRIGQETSGHTIVNSSGMEVFTDASTSVAQFGETARIGSEDGYRICQGGYEFVLTEDVLVVNGKTYYTRSGSGTSEDPYVFTEVQSPTSANTLTYYEKVPLGMRIIDSDNDEMMRITEKGQTIGKSLESHIELDYHSLQLIDKEGNTYFHVSDLRDENGILKISAGFSIFFPSFFGGSNEYFTEIFKFSLPFYAPDSDYTVETSTTSSSISEITVVEKTPTWYSVAVRHNSTAGNFSVSAKYTITSSDAKALTFGSRMLNSTVGLLSSAFGSSVASGGYISFAHGVSSNASGYTSFATGKNSTASGDYSFAQNLYTIAASDAQTALGKYNIKDSDDTYAVIIGNGTRSNTRSNALTIDWSGRVQLWNPNIERGTAPSSSIYGGGGTLQLTDKNGSQIGYFQPIQLSDGTEGFQLGVSNSDNTDWNTIQLAFDANDNPIVSVSDADKWRNALGITDTGWVNLPLDSAAKVYNNGAVPVYRRWGPIVNVVGAVSPKAEVSAGGSFTIAQLPSGCRPSRSIVTLCQGSGRNKWELEINTSGVLTASRYSGGTTNAAITTGTWLPFNVTFIIA